MTETDWENYWHPPGNSKLKIVYTGEQAPQMYNRSVFLAGPTARQDKGNLKVDINSWRQKAVSHLDRLGFDGVVFYPEYAPDATTTPSYDDQVAWERKNLDRADCILFWVPRDLVKLPAFTTNIEFGAYVNSGKVVLGTPQGAAKVRYMHWIMASMGQQFYPTLETSMDAVYEMTLEGAGRVLGERSVPQMVWNLDSFQKWYQSLLLNENRLDDSKILWAYQLPNGAVFAFSIWVKVWITAEERWKENEFIIARPDISMVLMFASPNLAVQNVLGTEIVLVTEFRSPVRNSQGMVVELAGGSSFKPTSARQTALDEIKEETGLEITNERLQEVQSRQVAATLSSHHAHLFTVRLTESEMMTAKKSADDDEVFGVEEDTERTYLEVKTLQQILEEGVVDWATLGMIFSGMFSPRL